MIQQTNSLIILIILLFSSIGSLSAQDFLKEKTPQIELYGFAKKEVTPNQITISVVLKERYEGRTKISIESQEKQLVEQLKASGIKQENIMLSDSESGYIKVKVLKKDVIATKIYTLKASNAQEVKKAFKVFDNLKIKDAFITKVSHTKIEVFKKELRIKAIKDAKDKGTYLLEAIGYELGIPKLIKESYANSDEINIRGSRANATNYYIDGIRVRGLSEDKKREQKQSNIIQYQKIKLEASIYVTFSIKENG